MAQIYKVKKTAIIYWVDPINGQVIPVDSGVTQYKRAGEIVSGVMQSLSWHQPGTLANSPNVSAYFLKFAPNRYLREPDVQLIRNSESNFSEQANSAPDSPPVFSVAKTETPDNTAWLKLALAYAISLLILFLIVYLISRAWKKGQQAT